MARPPLVWRDRNPSTARDFSDSPAGGLPAIVAQAWRALFPDTRAIEARRAARCEDANEPQIGAAYSVSSPSFTASPTSLAADSHAPSWNPNAAATREPLAAS